MQNQDTPKTFLGFDFGHLSKDIPAGLVVFLVALPLCLGIALASGAPLFSGIIAGIIGGIVVGSLSGSQLGVSGPAAGLAVIVAAAITDLGAFDIFLLAVVLGGLIQFTFGVLQFGVIGYYFPSSVVKGMLAAIGILIFYKQIPYALGLTKTSSFGDLLSQLGSVSPTAIMITVIGVAILLLWERPFIKKMKWTRIIQGPLVVVLLGVVINLVTRGSAFGLNQTQLVDIPAASNLAEMKNLFAFPDFSQILNQDVWIVAITLAIVASLETLLCLDATDKMDPDKRVSPSNQELRAQGIGNLVSGMIGGLPITQVIVRSSTNIQSGGKTKVSAVFHGFILLFAALMIPVLINFIPLSALAAILFMVGYKLSKPVLYSEAFKKGFAYFIPFIVTIVAIVGTNLLAGVIIGFFVAVFFILYNNYKKPFYFESENFDHETSVIRIKLAEDVTFINKANIQRALSQIEPESRVVIDASETINIDVDVIEIIEDFEIFAEANNIDLQVIGRKQKGIQTQAIKLFEQHMTSATPKVNGVKSKLNNINKLQQV